MCAIGVEQRIEMAADHAHIVFDNLMYALGDETP
jgi:hypothetical protein